MKKLVIVFFLCLYAVVLIQPFMPLINYSINKEFISKNLCENRAKPKLQCNGKCHLAKTIKSQAEQEEKTPSNHKSAEEILLFCSENQISLISPEIQIEKKSFFYTVKDYIEPQHNIFQPPQLLS